MDFAQPTERKKKQQEMQAQHQKEQDTKEKLEENVYDELLEIPSVERAVDDENEPVTNILEHGSLDIPLEKWHAQDGFDYMESYPEARGGQCAHCGKRFAFEMRFSHVLDGICTSCLVVQRSNAYVDGLILEKEKEIAALASL